MSKETEKQQIEEAEQRLENVEAALNRTEQILEEHQNGIIIGAIALLAIVGIYFLAKTQYFGPLKQEAQKEMFSAQYYFEADSFKLALNGDGQNMGFLEVIDQYSSTPAGKLAQYYAGVCYLKLGEFENAKSHLKAFSSDDETLNAFAVGLIGDAEAELGNIAEAESNYKKAANSKNQVAAPIFLQKLGAIYEKQGKADLAAATYERIKEEYPESALANSAEKNVLSVKK